MGVRGDFFVLVTGANSGLGYSICVRLIDEFATARPSEGRLHLLFTTRSWQKGEATAARLQKHIKKSGRAPRAFLHPWIVDLTSLLSVRTLATKLLEGVPRLDAVILNAGSGGFTGLNWPAAIWGVLTDLVHSVTWPSYKLSAVGSLTRRQCPPGNAGEKEAERVPKGNVEPARPQTRNSQEPPLGEIFCGNVFGHYLLAHYLAPLLSTRGDEAERAGRVIWISSLEADEAPVSTEDIQGLRSPIVYEHSKRLTDVLVLSSSLPSTQSWVQSYLDHSPGQESGARSNVKMYLAHPGVCATAIVPLHAILYYAMMMIMYVARLLGSPWHTLTAYSGASAPVWLTLSPQAQLDRVEAESGPGKWGSATDMWGRDRVMRTEVLGWGYGGKVGENVASRPGRRRGAVHLTEEALQGFEELGRGCWREMEELRERWEKILEAAVPAGKITRYSAQA